MAEMISYIAATNNPEMLKRNLAASLICQGSDELILIQNPQSIAKAYNEGQTKAKNDIKCYIHSDIKILNMQLFRNKLIHNCNKRIGMVGVIGSKTRTIPWPDGHRIGSLDIRILGTLDFSPGGTCMFLDGIMLATYQKIKWDESYPGFHMYDMDICSQMLDEGLPNLCLSSGKDMLYHDADYNKLIAWNECISIFHNKWNKKFQSERWVKKIDKKFKRFDKKYLRDYNI